jgi:hypothetical protein
MKSLIIVTLLISVSTSLAQITFQQNYGTLDEERAYAVEQTSDGGYLIAGERNTHGGSPDIYLVRIDELGDTLWKRTYPRTWSESGQALLKTSDGFLVAGYAVTATGPSRTDVYLLKTDSQGDTLWTRTIGGPRSEQAYDIQATSDGGYIIGGQVDDVTGQVYYYLVKTNSVGDSLWSKRYGLTVQEKAYGKAVQQTADGGYIIAGWVDDYTLGSGSGYIYLVKTDPTGIVEWTQPFDWAGLDLAYAILQVSDGYVIAGHTNSMGAGELDMLLIKIDGNRNLIWTKTYGDSSAERAYALQQTTEGGFIFSGMTSSMGAGFFDFYLVKTDSNGDTIWTRTFGGTHQEQAYDVKQTADGGYVLAGYSYSYHVAQADFWVVKTDGNGLVPIQHHKDQPIIQDYMLTQNYPNPFNPTTVFSWQLPISSQVELSIYNVTGEKITTLINKKQQAGFHSISWDASGMASGVYLYRLQAGDYVETRKMIVLK